MNFTGFPFAAAEVGLERNRLNRRAPPFRPKVKGAVSHVWLVVSLVVSLVPGFAMGSAQAMPRLQPALALFATQSPDQTVSVIVQKSVEDGSVERRLAQLGGRVTTDLSFIHALAAEISAKEAIELSQATGVKWVSLDAPVGQSDTQVTERFTSWATQPGAAVLTTFANSAAMADSPFGPNSSYGYGANAKGAFGGFDSEVTPGYAISRVEVVLQGYVPAVLQSGQDPILSVVVGGQAGKTVVLNHHAFDGFVGAAKSGTVYVDITSSRVWRWSDFDTGLDVVIDQGKFKPDQPIYYDAVGLRVTSQPGSDTSGGSGPTSLSKAAISLANLSSVYNQVVRATDVWDEGPAYLQGQGVTVAVVDSGMTKNSDLDKRLIAKVNFNATYHDAADRFGHGTFVAWMVAGDGKDSNGHYIGVAPKTNVISVRVSDDQGVAKESDVINSLQWVYQNKAKYNIRAVNLSLNSSVSQSYQTSPLDAAVEILWFNGVVVVVSAGNNGSASLYPPANDPFVITVGATDDHGTVSLADDNVATFSAYGVTEVGTPKPDLVAPGRNIVAFLPNNGNITFGRLYKSNQVNSKYFRMSGTSVSAPIVAGAVSLLLQAQPGLTPDQVKYRLLATANKAWAGYDPARAGAGYLDIYAAVHGNSTGNSNTGQPISSLLTTGLNGISASSVSWSSVSWSSVSWSSVSWSSVSWSSVSWSSDYWEP